MDDSLFISRRFILCPLKIPKTSCGEALILFLNLNKSRVMKGINYITDEKGNKTAVVISLKNYKEEILDFLDGLEASSRINEPSVDFEKTVNKIIKTKSRRESKRYL